jgi:DUF1365 family protein
MMNADPGLTASPAAALYPGRVMHARLRPFGHRFAYRVFSLLIDLDRLGEADQLTSLFSVRRFNLLSFDPKDHGPRDGSDLRAHIDRLLAVEGVDISGGRVELLCYPRVLGYVFNPLSIYFCTDADGDLRALVYEVRNTFGGMHAYVAPVRAGEIAGEEIRQARDKIFYVSPFLDMTMRYQFRIHAPGESFSVRILQSDPQGPIFSAAMRGQREPMSTRSVLEACASVPLLTVKVMAAIHWQALKLWLKGAKYHPESKRPAASTRPDLVPHRRKA